MQGYNSMGRQRSLQFYGPAPTILWQRFARRIIPHRILRAHFVRMSSEVPSKFYGEGVTAYNSMEKNDR